MALPLEGNNQREVIEDEKLAYSPLNRDKGEIRLLIISSDLDSAIVRCRLVHAVLEEAPAYTALSYCWGDLSHIKEIIVNNCKVSVTKNLATALLYLRQRGYLTVWADALCINQYDEVEKGHQILRMTGIYSKACQTVAWIGRDKRNLADIAAEHLDLLASQEPNSDFHEAIASSSRNFSDSKHSTAWTAFIHLLIAPYWRRTWIIQELAMSSCVVLMWGQRTLSLHTFVAALRALEGVRLFGWPLEYSIVVGVMNILERTARSPRPELALFDALNFSCLSECTEPIDKIFGILGLCSDGPSLLPTPDYRQSLEDILRHLTIARLTALPRANGTLDIIWLRSRGVTFCPDLPSWVVSWPDFWWQDNGYVWSSPEKRGLACGYKATSGSLTDVQFCDDHRTLICHGVLFDVIDDVSAWGRQAFELTAEQKSFQNSQLSIVNNIYGSETGVYESIWRSLVMDRQRTHPISDEESFRCQFSKLWADKEQVKGVRRSEEFRENLRTIEDFRIYNRSVKEWANWYAIQTNLPTEPSTVGRSAMVTTPASSDTDTKALADWKSDPMHRFVRSVRLGRMRRQLCVTQKGYVGMVHPHVRVGDCICLLQGATMPVVLRDSNGIFSVVGDAYVHGIMNGEAWDKTGSFMREFRLI